MKPLKVMDFATFMYQTGLVSTKPSEWHELFHNSRRRPNWTKS
jgi:hypothetical protein